MKRRLEGEAIFIAREWSEVYSREKGRLMRGRVEDLRSALDRNIEALEKEWAEVNDQFSAQGYSAELHERYQVELILASPLLYEISIITVNVQYHLSFSARTCKFCSFQHHRRPFPSP